nr:hypothetical protein [Leisingera sp. F5]
MTADMLARNFGPASQTSHLRACKRFASWLGRSPEAVTPDDLKHFQPHLIKSGTNICTHPGSAQPVGPGERRELAALDALLTVKGRFGLPNLKMPSA